MMRATDQEQTGGAGVNEASAKFERIGWGPVPNQAHDLGTDLLVQARDRRRFDRGLIVGVQVKAGTSWFEDEERDAKGGVLGWWYYEPGAAHFDDWVTHGLPHLLVLHNLECNTSYWVHVTAARVIRTGKGCKILVPSDQTIDEAHVEDLLHVAGQQKAAPRIEGTAFAASAQGIAPARRLRHALIAPRLVAPHRNLGYSDPIDPEEALALLSQGRFRDLQTFAEHHLSVPDPRDASPVRDWRWSFVRAMWNWATTDGIDGLTKAFGDAPDTSARAASGALLTCALLRQELHRKALDLLDGLLDGDDLGPVDQGWVLVQRARVRAELGDVPGGRNDAADAQRQFLGDTDDVTVSALAAAAAWQLFATADFGSGDLGGMLTASDTAVAWWRSRTISWALEESSVRAFRNWAEDSTTRWSAEDREALNLFSAELNADLTGEHGTWRSLAGAAARHRLVAAAVSGDEFRELVGGLDALRRSGDAASLKLAVAHLQQVGPVDAIAEAINRITLRSWTHTTAKGNLNFFAAAGDLVDSDAATGWVEWCANVLTDKAADFVGLVRPTFTPALTVAEAVSGLLPAADSAARCRVAELLASQTAPIDDLLARPLTAWIDELRYEELSAEVHAALQKLARSDRGRVGARLLGWLADGGDEDAKGEVLSRALEGDLNAVSAMGAVTVLTASEAAGLIDKFESMVCHTIEEAARSVYGFGAFDSGQGLAVLNCWFPEVARWDSLVKLLIDSRVAAEHKRGALELLTELSERLPEGVRTTLGESFDAVAQTGSVEMPGGRPIGGLAVALGIVTGGLLGSAADTAVARLALGSRQDRRDAAALLGRGWSKPMRPLLASFVADERAVVRSAAAHAVGRLATTEADEVVVELAHVLVEDRGALVPSALMAGLSRGENATDLGRKLAEQLARHRSARVRGLAAEFLHQDAEDSPR